MTESVERLHDLDTADAALLSELLSACEAQSAFVEIKLFRRNHYAQIDALDRLERQEYIRKERDFEREFYRVSLTAMDQLDQNEVACNIMCTADKLWSAFRNHYLQHLDQPVTLKQLADALGLSVDWVSRVHIYMREWSPTPCGFTPVDQLYQSVTVREEVLRHQAFSECVQQMRIWQADRIRSQNTGLLGANPFAALAESQATDLRSTPTSLPVWVNKLPLAAQILVHEVYTALDAKLLALPAMGIRAVIDVVSDHLLTTDLGDFATKLAALQDRSFITAQQFKSLMAVVNAGNAATHRAHVPDAEDIQIMLDSLSHMLQSAYVLDEATATLNSKTPARPKRSKQKGAA